MMAGISSMKLIDLKKKIIVKELFNKTVPYEHKTVETQRIQSQTYNFKVNGNRIRVSIVRGWKNNRAYTDWSNNYELVFTLNDDFAKLQNYSTKETILIFSTIIKIVEDFVKENPHIEELRFNAFDSKADKLYLALAKTLSKKYRLVFERRPNDYVLIFPVSYGLNEALLTELFHTVPDIRWREEKNEIIALFYVKKFKVEVFFSENQDSYMIDFEVDGYLKRSENRPTFSKKDSIEIFSGVYNSCKIFTEKYKPSRLVFGSPEKKKLAIYKSIAKKYPGVEISKEGNYINLYFPYHFWDNRKLNEAPISDFGIHGDLDSVGDTWGGSFRTQDIKALQNPKWAEKVKQSLDKTPYNFNLYFANMKYGIITNQFGKQINLRDINDVSSNIGIKPWEWITSELGIAKPKNASSAITVIFVDNEGDERVPLTPWIVVHRIVHALAESTENESMNKAFDIFNSLINELSLLRNNIPDIKSSDIPKLIGKMRSAKTGNIIRLGEFLIELFTQYIIQGKVTFNYPVLDKPHIEKSVDPKFEKYYKKALELESGRNFPQNGKEFAMMVLGTKDKPRSSIVVFDGETPIATASAEERMKREGRWKSSHSVREIKPNKQQMGAYTRHQNLFNILSAEWEKWKKEGKLDYSNSDIYKARLQRHEKKLDTAFDEILNKNVGKVFVI